MLLYTLMRSTLAWKVLILFRYRDDIRLHELQWFMIASKVLSMATISSSPWVAAL